MIKMIVTDLDRTLLKADGTISRYTQAMIDKAREKGFYFAIATARPESAVKLFLPTLEYDFAVYHNGALVYYGGQAPEHYGIASAVAMDICRKILSAHPKEEIVIEMDNMRYSNFDASRIWPGVEYVLTDFTDLPDKVAEKIIIPMKGEDSHLFAQYLTDELYIQVTDQTLCLIMNRKAEKLTGLQTICNKQGLSLSEVAAFGDDMNDIGMLRECGTGVAVANAFEAVREAADEICPSNEEDGVARWIESRLLSTDSATYIQYR